MSLHFIRGHDDIPQIPNGKVAFTLRGWRISRIITTAEAASQRIEIRLSVLLVHGNVNDGIQARRQIHKQVTNYQQTGVLNLRIKQFNDRYR